MDKYIINEHNGWEYELKGEQYYPTGRVIKNGVQTPPKDPEDNNPSDELFVGSWGQRHAAFLKTHQRSVYDEFLFSGKLNVYLSQIDRDAQEMFDLLVRQIAEQEGMTEQLKAKDQVCWVMLMNNIRHRAADVVNSELIFT